MAQWFVRSAATGAGTGLNWTDAYTTLAAATAVGAAGDTFWVADDHAESQAVAVSITSPGTTSNPIYIFCVDHTVASPTMSNLRTTGTITTTGANALTVAGNMYCYGLTFNCGSGATNVVLTLNSAAGQRSRFENCVLSKLGTTLNSSAITIGASASGLASYAEIINCSFQFGNTGDSLQVKNMICLFKNINNLITGINIPSTFITSQSISYFEGVDFTQLNGKIIVSSTVAADSYFKNCKFPSSYTISNPGYWGIRNFVTSSDSGPNGYKFAKYTFGGSETTETSITRAGGASDGTNSFSKKIVTTVNSKWIYPYDGIPISVYSTTTNSNVTLSIEGTWNSATVPNNDDVWMEVSYMGSALSPIATIVNNTKQYPLSTNAAWPASSSTWNGGGSGAGWSPFTMSITLTNPQPALAGYIYVTVKAAKASSTFYIDPLITIS